MIHPSPTTRIDPKLARGVLVEVQGATASLPGVVVISFPNSNYRVSLRATRPVTTAIGKRIIGTISASARRMDRVKTGGRYVEPVYGPIRRAQGAVVEVTPEAVVVDAGFPIHCVPTDPRQAPAQFQTGDFLSFDVLPDVTFTPAD